MEEEKILTYPEAARVISLYLEEFCDTDLPYTNMIAEAAREADRQIKKLQIIIEDLLFAYENKDDDFPHQFELDVVARAEQALKG